MRAILRHSAIRAFTGKVTLEKSAALSLVGPVCSKKLTRTQAMSPLGVIVIAVLAVLNGATSDHIPVQKVEEETPPPPPHPYSFAYTAGRFPGHVDRTHAEAGDEQGVVRGMYAYIDPRQQIRAVEYVADKNGFHAFLNVPISDTPAVAAAKVNHAHLYSQIAASNEGYAPIHLPSDTARVAAAKEKHKNLYQKIAEEHARISAEREALAATADYNYLKE